MKQRGGIWKQNFFCQPASTCSVCKDLLFGNNTFGSLSCLFFFFFSFWFVGWYLIRQKMTRMPIYPTVATLHVKLHKHCVSKFSFVSLLFTNSFKPMWDLNSYLHKFVCHLWQTNKSPPPYYFFFFTAYCCSSLLITVAEKELYRLVQHRLSKADKASQKG